MNYHGTKGTKFQLTLLAFVVGTLMLVLDKIDGAQWTMGIVGLVASYVAADVGSRFAEAKK